MIEPIVLARTFLETFDKSAVNEFRVWLSTRRHPTKWIIGADFALRDKARPGDCFAFSIIPYDTHPQAFAEEVRANIPKDLKKSKTLSPNAAAWLRDHRHFHVVIPMNRDRVFFDNGPGSQQSDVARRTLQISRDKCIELGRSQDQIRRFTTAISKAQANSFNIGMFTDLSLLGIYMALISVILCRESKAEIIGWFCDRDNMTKWSDGILWNIITENFYGIAENLNIDVKDVQVVAAVPDQNSGSEIMWFDQYIRSADWLAGSLASWDLKKIGFQVIMPNISA